MSECSISSHHSDSKCFTTNSNYYSQWSDNFLCRWKCNFNLECRFNLLMVNRCNHSNYKRYDRRYLYSKGNKCKRMSKCTISSHRGNCKCSAGNTNYYSRRSSNFLCRWQCNLNIKCRNKLPMVKWSNHAKHKRNNFRKLYSTSKKCKRMSECSICSNCSYCQRFTDNSNYYSQWSDNLLRRG